MVPALYGVPLEVRINISSKKNELKRKEKKRKKSDCMFLGDEWRRRKCRLVALRLHLKKKLQFQNINPQASSPYFITFFSVPSLESWKIPMKEFHRSINMEKVVVPSRTSWLSLIVLPSESHAHHQHVREKQRNSTFFLWARAFRSIHCVVLCDRRNCCFTALRNEQNKRENLRARSFV